MKLNWIYIVGLCLTLICVGCADDELVQQTSEGTIGNNEIYTTLHFNHIDSEKINITTRATLGVVPESRVQNIFVYLFVGETCVYTHYFDTSNRLANETEVSNAKWSCWYVNNMTSDANSSSNRTNGVIRMRTADITNGTLYLIANIDADMVNISPEKLNTIRTKQEIESLTATLNQEITSRNGYFPMTAKVSGITIADNTVKNSDGTQANAELVRLDAKIQVNVRTALNYVNTETEGEGNNAVITKQTLKGFIPKSWQIMNLPKGTYALPFKEDGTVQGDFEEAGYFNSIEVEGFETSTNEEITYKNNTTKKDTTITQTTHGFSFYMLQNKETMKKTVGTNYHLRDKRNKDDQGRYDETKGWWEYAPENATYMVIKGQIEMDVDVSTNAKQQHLAADVIYYIHLGDIASSLDNYSIERNTYYTYTITIKGVNSIEVEVQSSNSGNFEERESGATGMVYIAEEEIITFDAHYEQRVYMLDAASIDPDNVTWYVSTPFSEGMPKNIGGTEVPAGLDYQWVQFMVNQWADEDKTTYSKNNQSYPGYKGNDNQPLRSDSLMNVVEFTKFIKNEVRKLRKGEKSIFLKEKDEAWYNWYKTNNPTTTKTINDDGIWWRDRLYVTIFIDEFYYEVDPITGNKREGLWKEFVNQPNRLMHILCDNQESLDGASSSTGSIITIRQRSIQTPYDIAKTNTAWGCETLDETADSYFWFYNEEEKISDGDNANTLASQSAGNTSSLNGLFNTAKLWGYTKDNDENLMWSTYLDYNRPNSYKKDGDKYPRYWMTDGNAVLRYTPMMRNRDNDGDNYIDADEIRWYIASLEQIYGLYIGDQGLAPDAHLFPPSKRTLTKNDTYSSGHPLAGRYKYLEHIVSSTKHSSANTNTPIVVWAEEGVSTSYYRQEFGWSGWDNHGAQSIRCIRNLGLDKPTQFNILNEKENTPEKLISVTIPTGTIDENSVFEFDLTNVNPKSLRNYHSSHELEPTDEYNEMSRPYKKFATGPLYSTGNYMNLYNTLMQGKTPVTNTDYRVPNVREAALMMLYCDTYNDWWTTPIHTATYYSRGPKAQSEDMKIKPNYTWVLNKDRYSSLGSTTTSTRSVRDIPVE
ncbi:MAG: DUF4906 domain-containing protein [Bacteroidaceae bacterium]|nr:DUF4906 domain-containing protein [Bacteroidaceae bacterium]